MILTCTSIPPRLKYLPKFFRKLERQRLKPDAVELYLGRRYRRFPGEVPAPPPLPEWVKVVWVDDDLGPATKVLPATRAWRGKEVDLLYCDDDRVYDRNWTTRFAEARRAGSRDALCESGLQLSMVGLQVVSKRPGPRPIELPHSVNVRYRLKRNLSLGLYHPHRRKYDSPGYVDIAEGFGGVMVKPDWFDDEAFEIPDILWTVDDVWLSGHLARRGIAIATTRDPLRSHPMTGRHLPAQLTRHVEEGVGRAEANKACAEYFQKTYGIWV